MGTLRNPLALPVAPIGILANVLVARWRFADVQKQYSANRTRDNFLICAPALKGLDEVTIGSQ